MCKIKLGGVLKHFDLKWPEESVMNVVATKKYHRKCGHMHMKWMVATWFVGERVAPLFSFSRKEQGGNETQ